MQGGFETRPCPILIYAAYAEVTALPGLQRGAVVKRYWTAAAGGCGGSCPFEMTGSVSVSMRRVAVIDHRRGQMAVIIVHASGKRCRDAHMRAVVVRGSDVACKIAERGQMQQ